MTLPFTDQQAIRYASAMKRIGIYRRAIKELQRAYNYKTAVLAESQAAYKAVWRELIDARKELRRHAIRLADMKIPEYCEPPKYQEPPKLFWRFVLAFLASYGAIQLFVTILEKFVK